MLHRGDPPGVTLPVSYAAQLPTALSAPRAQGLERQDVNLTAGRRRSFRADRGPAAQAVGGPLQSSESLKVQVRKCVAGTPWHPLAKSS